MHFIVVWFEWMNEHYIIIVVPLLWLQIVSEKGDGGIVVSYMFYTLTAEAENFHNFFHKQ